MSDTDTHNWNIVVMPDTTITISARYDWYEGHLGINTKDGYTTQTDQRHPTEIAAYFAKEHKAIVAVIPADYDSDSKPRFIVTPYGVYKLLAKED